MKRLLAIVCLIPLYLSVVPAIAAPEVDPNIKRITTEVMDHGKAMSNLKELVAGGPRMSGSPQAERAVEWVKKKMESYGFDHVTLQSVEVPKWERGDRERATVLLPDGKSIELKMNALGGSVGTGAQPIEAEVVEVHNFKELAGLGDSVKGKIVFYNQPLDLKIENKFEAYGQLFPLRGSGASKAAAHGAVATMLRSLSTLNDDDHPHTGIMHYDEGVTQIPSTAISTHAANVLSDLLKKNPSLHVKLEVGAGPIQKAKSFNVIGEVTGSDFPKEVFLVGGHLDSWDLGVGAQDDGAGVVQSLEVVRAMKVLGIKPKRTIRVIAFMTEEFGGVGGEAFAKEALASSDHYFGVMESDRGGFKPTGFTVHAPLSIHQKVKAWRADLAPMSADRFFPSNHGGTDTEVFGEAGVPEFELAPESAHYFDFHHSALDQITAVNPADLQMGAAAMAVFIYHAAEEGL